MADLSNLKDIHLPKAIGWWPVAIGWYIVACFVVLLFLLIVFKLHRHYKNIQYRRKALRLLADYKIQYQRQGQAQEISAKITQLLKQIALIYFPRQTVAGLMGEDWIKFLNETSKDIDFNSVRQYMLELPYQKTTNDVDLEPLFGCIQAWIKQRDVPCSN